MNITHETMSVWRDAARQEVNIVANGVRITLSDAEAHTLIAAVSQNAPPPSQDPPVPAARPESKGAIDHDSKVVAGFRALVEDGLAGEQRASGPGSRRMVPG